jgi:hypothetical protein
MIVRTISLQREIPQVRTYFGGQGYNISRPETKQNFIVYGKDIQFDISMLTHDGFYLPVDCDVDMEIKFTIIPKPQSPVIKTFK